MSKMLFIFFFEKKKNFFFWIIFKNNLMEKNLFKKYIVKIKRNNIFWDLRKLILNMLVYVIYFSLVWLIICGIYLFFFLRDK